MNGNAENKKPFVINSKSGSYIVFSDNDLITSFLIKKGEWESHIVGLLSVFLEQSNGDMIDVGANMGAITVPLAMKYSQRRFYCFEAQRLVYQQLCGNAVLNGAFNIYPYHLAIGSLDDMGTMIDVPVPDYARDANIGSISLDKRVVEANGDSFTSFEKVSLVPMDALGMTNIGAIKIDVEGMELSVIKGMLETLKNNNYPPVLFEVWAPKKYQWVAQEQSEIKTILEALGYVVTIYDKAKLGIAQHNSREFLDIQLNFSVDT